MTKKKTSKKAEKQTTEIAEAQNSAALSTTHSAEMLIAQAIDKNVPVETMERLLAMRRELKAEWAKEQFDHAMAEFQRICPVIKKNRAVYERDGQTVRYKYAPLDDIVQQTKEYIAQCGLSYTILTRNEGEGANLFLVSVCRVTHESGHSEDYEFKVPVGSEQFMSDVQKYGARSTFSKRYAFCNAFGILTGDEDDDAISTKTNENQPKQNNRPVHQKKPDPATNESSIEVMHKQKILKLCIAMAELSQMPVPVKYPEFDAICKQFTSLEFKPENFQKLIKELDAKLEELQQDASKNEAVDGQLVDDETEKIIEENFGIDREPEAKSRAGELVKKGLSDYQAKKGAQSDEIIH